MSNLRTCEEYMSTFFVLKFRREKCVSIFVIVFLQPRMKSFLRIMQIYFINVTGICKIHALVQPLGTKSGGYLNTFDSLLWPFRSKAKNEYSNVLL